MVTVLPAANRGADLRRAAGRSSELHKLLPRRATPDLEGARLSGNRSSAGIIGPVARWSPAYSAISKQPPARSSRSSTSTAIGTRAS